MVYLISFQKAEEGITKGKNRITFTKKAIVKEHVALVNALKKQPNKTPILTKITKKQTKELSEYKEL